MTSNQEMAFPRGKRQKTSSTTAIATAAGSSSVSVPHKDHDRHRTASPSSSSSKKRPSHSIAASNVTTNSSSAANNKDKDFLFGGGELDIPASNTNAPGHTKKKQRSHNDDDGISSNLTPGVGGVGLGGGGVIPSALTSTGRRIPAKIDLLAFSKLAKGTKVLGVLREVQEEYAVVSLPTMLTGFVRRSSVRVCYDA